MSRLACGLLIWLLALLAPGVWAHESMPASLLLQAQPDGTVEVRWRLPQTQGPAPDVAPRFPAACAALDGVQSSKLPGAHLMQWHIRCPQDLADGTRIEFPGLEATMVDVLVRLEDVRGTVASHIARPRTPWVILGNAPAQSLSVASYFGLGVEHILTGVDHLLFLLCLVLLVPTLRGLVKTITAFTLAHSITLALSALGVVHVAQAPAEATIALSILFLARELALRDQSQRLATRQPWTVAFAFGLLHGFGFAGALAEVGLPQGDIPAALLLFNLGVEAGQLAFVACTVPLVALVRRWGSTALRWAAAMPVYAVGAVAGFWWLQRLGPVLGLQAA